MLAAVVLALTGAGTTAASAAVSTVEVTARLGGDPVTVHTVEPGQDAIVTFDARAGQRALVEITDIRLGGMRLYLRDVRDATLRQASCSDGLECVLDTAELTASGRYSLYLDATQLSYGVATVQLHEVPPDLRAGYAVGDPATTVTTDAPGQDAYLLFAGWAGQRVFTRVSAGTVGTITAYLLDARGTVLGGGICDVPCDIDTVTLPADGDYRLLLSPSGVRRGSLTVQVLDVPADAEAVTGLGRPVPVTTTVPGQNARVSFDARAGDRVTVAVTESGFTAGRIALHGPGGETLAAGDCARTCALSGVPVATSGTHAVLLDPAGAQTGTAVVTVTVSVPDLMVVVEPGGGEVTLTMTQAGQNAAVAFAGVAGQHVSAVFTKGSLTRATASLRGPDGAVLASAPCAVSCFLDVRSLPVDGRYVIHVDPDGAHTGAITVRVHDVPADPVVTVVPGGATVSLTTAVPGQNAFADFPAARGDRTFIQLSGGTFGNASGYLRDPAGTALAVAQCASACAFDAGAAGTDGTYRIALDPQGAETGGVSVRVHAVPPDPVVHTVPGGAPVTAATGTPGQNAVVSFPGVAGQRVSARLTGGTFGPAGLTLRDPDGGTLASFGSCGTTCFADTVVLPVTGDYTVLINPAGAAVGSGTIQVHEVPPDASGSVRVGGGPVSVPVRVPGQNAAVTFDGAAGQVVTVTVEAGLGATTYQLRGADGGLLASRSGTAAATVTLGPVTLTAAGTQTLTVNPATHAVGTATVSVS